MDPDAALAQAWEALDAWEAAGTQPEKINAAADLIEAFEALDQWLQKGGALPAPWAR